MLLYASAYSYENRSHLVTSNSSIELNVFPEIRTTSLSNCIPFVILHQTRLRLNQTCQHS